MNFPQERDKKIMLQGPVGALEALSSVPKENPVKAVVIICHPHPLYQGTMNNKVVFSMARAFESLGLKTVRFNYRGVGTSEGEYGEAVGEAEDALAVLKWAQSVLPDHEVWLAGFSFGGYVAARAASFLRAKEAERSRLKAGMTPEVGVTSETGMTPEVGLTQEVGLTPAVGVAFEIKQLLTIAPSVEHFDINALSEINAPWFVIQGEADEVVPTEAVKKWVEQSREKPELVLLPDTGHFFHGHLPELKSIIIKHYENKVPQ